METELGRKKKNSICVHLKIFCDNFSLCFHFLCYINMRDFKKSLVFTFGNNFFWWSVWVFMMAMWIKVGSFSWFWPIFVLEMSCKAQQNYIIGLNRQWVLFLWHLYSLVLWFDMTQRRVKLIFPCCCTDRERKDIINILNFCTQERIKDFFLSTGNKILFTNNCFISNHLKVKQTFHRTKKLYLWQARYFRVLSALAMYMFKDNHWDFHFSLNQY